MSDMPTALQALPMCFKLSGGLAADLELTAGGWPWPIAPADRTIIGAIGVVLLSPAATRHNRR